MAAKLNGFNAKCLAAIVSDGKKLSKAERAQIIHEQSVGSDDFLTTKATTRNDDPLPQSEPIRGKRLFDLCAALRSQKLKWLGHGLRLNDDELLKKFIVGVCWPKYQKGLADYGIFQDAFTGRHAQRTLPRGYPRSVYTPTRCSPRERHKQLKRRSANQEV